MRGIREESLKNITPLDASEHRLLKYLIVTECKELTPWKPIATAPKDRRVLAYNKVTGCYITKYDNGDWPLRNGDLVNETHYPHPTHWSELPPNPELPEDPRE